MCNLYHSLCVCSSSFFFFFSMLHLLCLLLPLQFLCPYFFLPSSSLPFPSDFILFRSSTLLPPSGNMVSVFLLSSGPSPLFLSSSTIPFRRVCIFHLCESQATSHLSTSFCSQKSPWLLTLLGVKNL